MIDMVFEKKEGEAVAINIPKWMLNKWFLVAMAIALIAGFVYMSPGLNTAVFGTPVKTTDPPEVKTAEALATEQTAIFANTDLLKKLEADKNDPILAQRIARWPRLLAINALPQEIKIDPQYEVYITGLTMSNGILKGNIENRGSENIAVDHGGFQFISPDYFLLGAVDTGKINGFVATGENWMFSPNSKKEFVTMNFDLDPRAGKIGFIALDHTIRKLDN